jgi:hypothetical protein
MRVELPLKSVPKEMQERIKRAMHNTWDAIGGDALTMVQECNGRDYMTKAEVIEMVCDAGYMDMYGEDKEAYKVFDQLSYDDMKKLGKEAFTYKRYGW